MSLIAKLGSVHMLGEYALAVAVAMPVAMLTHLNLRAVLATDVDDKHAFGDYLAVRYVVSTAGIATIALLAVLAANTAADMAAIVLVGLSLSVENISDVYYGPLQRRERMDQVARSILARAGVSLLSIAAVLWWTRNLVAALGALALARLAVLLIYDRPRGRRGERLGRTNAATQFEIFRTALPLGFVLMLGSLSANIPRYAIERRIGTVELGAFAAAASFANVGNAILQALGQSALPRLARYFTTGDRRAYRKLTLAVIGIAGAVGLAGVAVASAVGDFALRLLYRPEYAAYQDVLVAVMGASVCTYVAVALGYASTSARAFRAQMVLLAVVVCVCAAASEALVPRFGLKGAAMSLAVAAVVQIAGQLLILRKALRTVEQHA